LFEFRVDSRLSVARLTVQREWLFHYGVHISLPVLLVIIPNFVSLDAVEGVDVLHLLVDLV
jgi:hypothetical protein